MKRSSTCNHMRATSFDSFSTKIFLHVLCRDIFFIKVTYTNFCVLSNWKKRLKFNIVANGKIKADILGMADRIAKRSEIWDSRVLVDHKWDTFDFFNFVSVFVSFFLILGLFSTLVSNTCKIRATGLRFGTLWLVEYIWYTFDLIVLKVIWGHSVHVFQKGLTVSKIASCRVKQIEIWDIVTLATFDFAVFKVTLGHSMHVFQN